MLEIYYGALSLHPYVYKIFPAREGYFLELSFLHYSTPKDLKEELRINSLHEVGDWGRTYQPFFIQFRGGESFRCSAILNYLPKVNTALIYPEFQWLWTYGNPYDYFDRIETAIAAAKEAES